MISVVARRALSLERLALVVLGSQFMKIDEPIEELNLAQCRVQWQQNRLDVEAGRPLTFMLTPAQIAAVKASIKEESNSTDVSSVDASSKDEAPRGLLPLSARAMDRRLRISVSPGRSVRPLTVFVKESDGTAWRVVTVTVDGIDRWYGDPPYPICRGNRWIDLEVECPHDHPPTEERPIELRGCVLCEASTLPVSTDYTERDRQWSEAWGRGGHESFSRVDAEWHARLARTRASS